MFYGIYDETGKILQGNKIYFPEDQYEKAVNDLGQKFVKRKNTEMLSPDEYWVKAGRFSKRPTMFVTVSSRIVKAGGVDAAVLRGCPVGAKWALMLLDLKEAPAIAHGVVDDPDMEFPFDTPGRYAVVFDRWPYRTLKIDIEAVP